MSLITSRRFLFGILILLLFSIFLSVFSFYSITGTETFTRTVINDTFSLSTQETYRQGLGSFHGNENITLIIKSNSSYPFDFELTTYNGQQYNISATQFTYSFSSGADYYDAVFTAPTLKNNPADSILIDLNVYAQSIEKFYPLSWMSIPAKLLFITSWAALILLILKPEFTSCLINSQNSSLRLPTLSMKSRRTIQVIVVVSLVFWFALLALNNYPLGTFENWYTDSARHPYTANLFTKVGFSVFDTPLGQLSSADNSFYKFVTWPEMPHLYPLGSILLFLPFGAMLEAGIAVSLVLKLEIALFLVVSHICLYYFLKQFWNQSLNCILKTVGIYIFYVVLVLYSANGQFDAIAFLFALFSIIMFLDKRYDAFLLFVAVSATFKYQTAIFLAPLLIVGLLRLFNNPPNLKTIKNKYIIAAFTLFTVNLFTAILSMPYLTNTRSDLIMNGVNAFSPHGQISWELQAFIVLLFVSITLFVSVRLMNKSRLVSLFAVFSLLPCLTMPYFQPWYLPLFFVYLLIPQNKHSLQITIVWIVFVAIVLSFGGLSYNPLFILDRVRGVLTFPYLNIFA